MKIDTYVSGCFLVSGSTLLAVAGLLIVRRVLHTKNLISSHDVGGYLLSVVGTMYAVILGLIVVDAMADFQLARETTERESNALADVVLLAKHLPAEKRDQIRTLALTYVDRVIEDEWPILDHGQIAPSARLAALNLIDAVAAFEPNSEKEQQIYASALTAVCEFWNNRRTRTVAAAHGVPGLEWFVLIVGGTITVAFTYFFKLEHLRIQVVMTAMVAMIISLCIFLVLMFGYPFSGQLKVGTSGFRVTQAIIDYQVGRATTPVGPSGH